MAAITAESLMSLEQYARARKEFRAKVLAHKKPRTIRLGDHVTLVFEDELTMRYQVQEMLRVERIFEEEGILDELEAYNPLVPDGSNWKATMLIEYPDPGERKAALARLIGIEDKVWVRIGPGEKCYAIADEDLDRENDEKTSSVHFLRFELDERAKGALRAGDPLAVGVDHPAYAAACDPVSPESRASLLGDLRF
jgi:hypothetical protein